MKTFKCFRIGMIGIVTLIVLGYSSRAMAAIDAFLIFTDSSGKATKVQVKPDGSFTTSALHAGTYRWSFVAMQSGAATGANGSTGKMSSSGDNPTESLTLNFTKITISYTVVAPIDHNSGATTGKRQHSPVTIVREVDKASPKMMTNLGTIVIDAKGETVSGTVAGITKDGNKTSMDSWDAK